MLQNELSGLYLKAGLKNVGIMFLMTDAQVPNEHFLVLINDMLASGEVPDLFGDDDVENIIAGVRNEASTNIRNEYDLLNIALKYMYNLFLLSILQSILYEKGIHNTPALSTLRCGSETGSVKARDTF